MSAQGYWRNDEQSSGAYNSQQGYDQGYSQQQQQYGGPNDNYNSGHNNQQYGYGYGYGSGQSEPPAYNAGPNYNYPSENQSYTQHQSYQSNEQWSSTSSWDNPPPQQHQQSYPQQYPNNFQDTRQDPYSSNMNPGYGEGPPPHLPPGAAAQPVPEAQYPPGPGAEPVEGERGLLGAIAGGAAGAYGGHKVGHGFIGAVGGAYAGHKLEDHWKDKRKAEKKERRRLQGRRNSSSSSSSSSSDDEKKKKKKDKYGQPGPQGWGDKWGNLSHDDKMKYGLGAAGVAAAGGAGYYAWQHHQQQQGHGGAPMPPQGHGGSREVLAGNFSGSSSQITLDGDYDLIASCGTVDGHQKLSSISLNDCLGNEWGKFVWQRGGGFAQSSRNIRLVDGGRVLEAELGNGRGGWDRQHIRLDEKITNDNGELKFLG